MKRSRRLLFGSILVLVSAVPTLLLLWLTRALWGPLLLVALNGTLLERLPEDARATVYRQLLDGTDLAGPELVDFAMGQLSEEEKSALYDRVAADSASWYDTLPEAGVGRIGKRKITTDFRGAEIQTNNVGLRDHDDYGPKPDGVYRIACLGDSMVFGAAGKEEDRFCDQIEAYYNALGGIDGRTVQAYALGIGSWTMHNEATYLNSRISSYDPDLILVLSVHNDITDSLGVTGAGIATRQFTPDQRHLGTSGFFLRPPNYPSGGYTALLGDLAPEAQKRWTQGMSGLKRLEELQTRRGKKIFFGLLDGHPLFVATFKHHFTQSDIQSPLILVRYAIEGEKSVLAHDPHPNRHGHGLMANHFIHALADHALVPLAADQLPGLHPALTTTSIVPSDPTTFRELRRSTARRLPSRLQFDDLDAADLNAYLGGFFPERRAGALSTPPFASLRSAFVLRRPRGVDARLRLEIDVPARTELYPFALDVTLQGHPATTFRLDDPSAAGRHTIEAPIPELRPADVAVEVLLETDSYWTTITDARMKSFYLISAALE